MKLEPFFTSLNIEEEKLPKPKSFNFPFNHTPNGISFLAASILKEELKNKKLNHNFDALGKMFGVLVVENCNGDNGSMAGLMATGRFSTGFKHSGMMIVVALVIFNFVAFSPDLIGVTEIPGLNPSRGTFVPSPLFWG